MIEGIPDGWELVRVGRPKRGEFIIDQLSFPKLVEIHSDDEKYLNQNYIIIRKVVKPKQYRPFANAEEFKPHRNRWVRIISEDNASVDFEGDLDTLQRIAAYSNDSVCVWGGWILNDDALNCFVFDDDGSPFGVEVTE